MGLGSVLHKFVGDEGLLTFSRSQLVYCMRRSRRDTPMQSDGGLAYWEGGSPGLDLDVGACSESRLGGASMTAGEALTYR